MSIPENAINPTFKLEFTTVQKVARFNEEFWDAGRRQELQDQGML